MSNEKFSIEYIREYFAKQGFELLYNDYKNIHTKVTLKDNYGYLFYSDYTHIKRGNNIQFVGKHNPYTIKNIKLWCIVNNKLFELISKEYQSPHNDLLWKCFKCNEIFKMPWGRASQDGGCGYCHGKQVGVHNCLSFTHPELAKEWHPTKNGYLTPYNTSKGSRKDIWWKCNVCGYEWKVKPNSRTFFDTGCPECNKSKGEKRIKEIIDINHIYYIPQMEFNSLLGVNNGNLSYDFYLPDYNLLIEYQGKQHECYINGFHKSSKDFEKQQEHDKRKREYAKNNNMNLLEIWYWNFNNIEEILNNIFIDTTAINNIK